MDRHLDGARVGPQTPDRFHARQVGAVGQLHGRVIRFYARKLVGGNIAEGSKRRSKIDKARIFNIAESEAAEAMSVLDVAERLAYGEKGGAQRLSKIYDELLGMIEALRQKVVGPDDE